MSNVGDLLVASIVSMAWLAPSKPFFSTISCVLILGATTTIRKVTVPLCDCVIMQSLECGFADLYTYIYICIEIENDLVMQKYFVLYIQREIT